MIYKVAVFGYDFCHKKTQDILTNLYIYGIRDVVVFLAPRILIEKNEIDKPFKSISNEELIHPQDICINLGFQYLVSSHNNFDQIRQLSKNHKRNLAIISGARILNKNIINLFQYGVINYHPGSLPETSGLDSLFWMIRKNSKPIATSHFIDEKVDAGRLIEKQQIKLDQDDTISIVEYKLYVAQMNLHKNICMKILNNEEFKSKKIERISKNEQMNQKEVNDAFLNFDLWKKYLMS